MTDPTPTFDFDLFSRIFQNTDLMYGIDYLTGIILMFSIMGIITRDINKWKVLAFPITVMLTIIGVKTSILTLVITGIIFVIEALSIDTLTSLANPIIEIIPTTEEIRKGASYIPGTPWQKKRIEKKTKKEELKLLKEKALKQKVDFYSPEAIKKREEERAKTQEKRDEKISKDIKRRQKELDKKYQTNQAKIEERYAKGQLTQQQYWKERAEEQKRRNEQQEEMWKKRDQTYQDNQKKMQERYEKQDKITEEFRKAQKTYFEETKKKRTEEKEFWKQANKDKDFYYKVGMGVQEKFHPEVVERVRREMAETPEEKKKRENEARFKRMIEGLE